MKTKILLFYAFMMLFFSAKSQTLQKNDLAKLGLHGAVKTIITSTSEDYNFNMPYDSINFNKDGFITTKYTISSSCCDSNRKSNKFIANSATYYYDSLQYLIKIVTVNEYLHSVFQIDSNEYDNNKNIIAINTIKHWNSSDEITKDTLIYSNKGKLIEKRTVSNSRPASNSFVYKYNDMEKLTEMSNFIGKNQLFVKDNFFYDENGNQIKRTSYNGVNHTYVYTYRFDAKKNWIQKIVNNDDILKRKIYYY